MSLLFYTVRRWERDAGGAQASPDASAS